MLDYSIENILSFEPCIYIYKKYNKNYKIHVETSRNVMFPNEKINAKNNTGFGVGWGYRAGLGYKGGMKKGRRNYASMTTNLSILSYLYQLDKLPIGLPGCYPSRQGKLNVHRAGLSPNSLHQTRTSVLIPRANAQVLKESVVFNTIFHTKFVRKHVFSIILCEQ